MLALARQRQGQAGAARAALAQAEMWLQQTAQGQPAPLLRLNLMEGLAFLVLLQEARAQVQPAAEPR